MLCGPPSATGLQDGISLGWESGGWSSPLHCLIFLPLGLHSAQGGRGQDTPLICLLPFSVQWQPNCSLFRESKYNTKFLTLNAFLKTCGGKSYISLILEQEMKSFVGYRWSWDFRIWTKWFFHFWGAMTVGVPVIAGLLKAPSSIWVWKPPWFALIHPPSCNQMMCFPSLWNAFNSKDWMLV